MIHHYPYKDNGAYSFPYPSTPQLWRNKRHRHRQVAVEHVHSLTVKDRHAGIDEADVQSI